MATNYEELTRYNESQLGRDTASRKGQVDMYSEFSHFIYEILQNADDYKATTIRFILNKNSLTVEHDGVPFTSENVRAITYFGRSTSRNDLVKTGRFGLGFKSVFAFTATPIINSGHENFKIYDLYKVQASSRPNELDQEKTRIYLPFNHEEEKPDYVETHVSKDYAFDKIREKLKKLDPATLLFTRNLKRIEYDILNDFGSYIREDRDKSDFSGQLSTRTSVITIGENLSTYLVFSRPIIWENESHKPVDIAFNLEVDNQAEILSIERPLSVLFPTTQKTDMGFILNGPYRTPAHRETVSQDNRFNGFLVEETGDLLCEALPRIKKMNLLTVDCIDNLPINFDFYQESMFRPIYEKVRVSLRRKDLLPTATGGYVSGENAKLARSKDLVELISTDQLSMLFNPNGNLQWLSTEITENKRKSLYEYLVGREYGHYLNKKELKPISDNIEIRPEKLLKALTKEFLQKQSDLWTSNFYLFLLKHGSLRPEFKDIPFIRLENGDHVIPIDENKNPCAYFPSENETEFPQVKSCLIVDYEVRTFLKGMGISEIDPVAEVLSKVLPKYSCDNLKISSEKYSLDFRRIVNAYKIDSYNRKEELVEKLKVTPFLMAESTLSPGTVKHKLPGDVYLGSKELRSYFSGDNSAWFLDNIAHEIYVKNNPTFFEDLKVLREPRIKKEYFDWERYGIDTTYVDGFIYDFKIHGLENALVNINDNPDVSKYVWAFLSKYINEFKIELKGVIKGCNNRQFPGGHRTMVSKELNTTAFNILNKYKWLPDQNGNLHKPSELAPGDMHESFQINEKLIEQLGMKSDVMAELAEKAGISMDTMDLAIQLEQNPELLEEARRLIQEHGREGGFPENQSGNRERRDERLGERMSSSPGRSYANISRSTRTSSIPRRDKEIYLMEKYTNEAGEMYCQICKEVAFKKRNGEYYFEAIEIFDESILTKENVEQYLALCPLCAAKYKEFIKLDEDAMQRLKENIINSESLKIKIQLGQYNASIKFVEKHFGDLKVALQEMH